MKYVYASSLLRFHLLWCQNQSVIERFYWNCKGCIRKCIGPVHIPWLCQCLTRPVSRHALSASLRAQFLNEKKKKNKNSKLKGYMTHMLGLPIELLWEEGGDLG